MEKIFKNKTILVTGGVGSIGSKIVEHLLLHSPKQVRVFDINETGLFNLQAVLKNAEILRLLVGDVRDYKRVDKAMDGVDIVFHAAALKHVPLSEYNPFEAIKTNVIGTENVIDSALTANVEKVLIISTDKAVNPLSTMGASKLLAERLGVAANYHRGAKKTKFAAVRFGNVLGSQGSVLSVFEEQIKAGGPVTITDNRMSRFMMSISEAVGLVLKASENMQGGEIFILKMPVIYTKDFAAAMVRYLNPKVGVNKEIKFKIIGIRPGEKLFEELMTEKEANNALEDKKMFVVLPEVFGNHSELKKFYKNLQKTKISRYSSSNQKKLSQKKIVGLLEAFYSKK